MPAGLVVARTTPTWTVESMPNGLRGTHRASAWAELVVVQGSIVFIEDDTGFEATAVPGHLVTIVPDRDHHIVPTAEAEFFIRFFAGPS